MFKEPGRGVGKGPVVFVNPSEISKFKWERHKSEVEGALKQAERDEREGVEDSSSVKRPEYLVSCSCPSSGSHFLTPMSTRSSFLWLDILPYQNFNDLCHYSSLAHSILS